MNLAKKQHGVLNKPSQIYFCPACKMQFSNRKLYEVHKKQQDHLKNEKAQESKEENRTHCNETSGIYVRGYPPNTKESSLVKYFSQFGNVIWAHFGHDYLLLDFTESSAVVKVMLKNAHILHGHRLIVKRKSTSRVSTNDFEKTEKIYQDIIAELKSLNNFDEEFLCMAQKLQPNLREYFKKYNLICQDLYNFLSGSFANMQVHPFGSTLTGLSFTSSDVDVFFSQVKQIESKELDYLTTIKRELVKSGKFANCFIITTAKVPLIKCIHKETQIKCDININNILAVCNSKLIHYYMSIDLKVKQVMIILKYWAKCHKITGPTHLFSNYSLTMMFIFFLQQEPYNFPSVLSLQETQCRQYQCGNFNWNGQFVPNYNFVSECLSWRSILEVLEGFFDFYSQFSYQTNIICPYLGKSLPTTYFAEPQSLPPIYSGYKTFLATEKNDKFALKVNNCICIQDPFEHCRNTAGSTTMPTLEKFILLCKLGKTICASRENILFNLLTQQLPNLNKQIQTDGEDFYEIILRQYSFINKSSNDRFQFVVEFTTMTLKEFLLIPLTQVFDETTEKNGPTNKSNTKKLVFTGTVNVNMWHARRSTAKQLNLSNSNSTLMRREIAITNHLKQSQMNLLDTTDVFTFKLTIKEKNEEEAQKKRNKRKNAQQVMIQVEKVTAQKKSFKTFGQFLKGNLPLWFELYVKDL
ncbi:speckle targeted PIP5K1A-regulated poly(A) polymerase-like [Euwallacea fornicatus]|uniref:speckle targeted PIP5K1A-regulated poly(A) polymerase-like n=1 Tax=Euwallacea fornicatus TaxID=995702 RepID=UPI00338D7ECB